MKPSYLVLDGDLTRLQFAELVNQRRHRLTDGDGVNDSRNPFPHVHTFEVECRLRVSHVVSLGQEDDLLNSLRRERMLFDGLQNLFIHLGDGDTESIRASAGDPVTVANILGHAALLSATGLDHQPTAASSARREARQQVQHAVLWWSARQATTLETHGLTGNVFAARGARLPQVVRYDAEMFDLGCDPL